MISATLRRSPTLTAAAPASLRPRCVTASLTSLFSSCSLCVRMFASCQNRLSRAGFNESLSHESLVSLSDEIAQLSRDIEPLDQQLHYYQQLPPVSCTHIFTYAHTRLRTFSASCRAPQSATVERALSVVLALTPPLLCFPSLRI